MSSRGLCWLLTRTSICIPPDCCDVRWPVTAPCPHLAPLCKCHQLLPIHSSPVTCTLYCVSIILTNYSQFRSTSSNAEQMTDIYCTNCPLGQVKERDNECYSPRCLVWMILIRELVPSLLHRTAQVLTQVKFQSVLVTTAAAAAEESCGRYCHVPSPITGYRVDTKRRVNEWTTPAAARLQQS